MAATWKWKGWGMSFTNAWRNVYHPASVAPPRPFSHIAIFMNAPLGKIWVHGSLNLQKSLLINFTWTCPWMYVCINVYTFYICGVVMCIVREHQLLSVNDFYPFHTDQKLYTIQWKACFKSNHLFSLNPNSNHDWIQMLLFNTIKTFKKESQSIVIGK